MTIKILALCLFTLGLFFLNYKAKLTHYQKNPSTYSGKSFYMDSPSPLK